MSNTKAYLIVCLIRFIYALAQIVTKGGFNQGFSIPVFTFYRHLVASFFLAPVALFCERKNAPPLSYKIAFKLFLHSLYGIAAAVNIFSIGLKYTSAVSSSSISNLLPVIAFILAAILRMESLKLKKVHGLLKFSGIMLCTGGVANLAFYMGPVLNSINHHHLLNTKTAAHATGSKPRWILGTFLTTLAIFQWSLWTVLMFETIILGANVGGVPFEAFNCDPAVRITMIQSFFMALVLERDFLRWKLDFDVSLLAILYCGIVVSGMTYYLQAWAIQMKGPVFLAMSMPLTLIFTLMLSSIVLGEAITLGSILGGVLMVGGLYNVLWGKRIEEGEENDKIIEKNHDKEASLEDRKIKLQIENDHT